MKERISKLTVLCAMIMVSLFLTSGNTWAGVPERLAILEATVVAQQAEIAVLQTQLAAVQSNPVLDLGSYVSVDLNELNGLAGPHVLFDSVNLHVRNGDPTPCNFTSSCIVNGLGNLVIGYNEIDGSLAAGDRGGSHNLVMGYGNRFRSWSGIAHGFRNTIDVGGEHAVVLSGDRNIVSSWSGTLIGGFFNTTTSASYLDVIVGGKRNTTSDAAAVVVGGDMNTASGIWSVVAGGYANTASGGHATIAGGDSNIASGGVSSIVGGETNTATGVWSVVTGGNDNISSALHSTVTGGDSNTASGDASSVSGGANRSATGLYDWAAGSLWEDQ